MSDISARARETAHALAVKHHEEYKPGFVYLRRRDLTEADARVIQDLIDSERQRWLHTDPRLQPNEALIEVHRLGRELLEEKKNTVIAAEIARDRLTQLHEAQIDADHDWALWNEKWRATMDTLGHLGAQLVAVRDIWPHIEIPVGLKPNMVLQDPGAPTCIRCKIEKAIEEASRG